MATILGHALSRHILIHNTHSRDTNVGDFEVNPQSEGLILVIFNNGHYWETEESLGGSFTTGTPLKAIGEAPTKEQDCETATKKRKLFRKLRPSPGVLVLESSEGEASEDSEGAHKEARREKLISVIHT